MRHRRGVDKNQGELDRLARMIGAHIIDTTGDPDIGFDRIYVVRGKTYIVEVKDGRNIPSKRQLTKTETKRKNEIEARGVKYHVIESVSELMTMFGIEVNL